jgi:membrane protein
MPSTDTKNRPHDGTVAVFKRTIREFRADNVTDWAAALTYYGVLSIFPALIALVSIVGLLGKSTQNTLTKNLASFTPGPARTIVNSAINGLASNRGGAGILLVVGILAALWSASGYIAAFMRASNAIWDVEEGRPVWKTIPVRLGVTFVVVVMLAISALAVILTGNVANKAGRLLGLGSTFVTVWDIAKWPVLLLVVATVFAILYYASPNVKHPSFKWITPGGLIAVAIWVVASLAFAFYVANFGSYNKTYGSLAAVIAFLVWLWISNVALLFGAEYNAERERGRAIAEGYPEDKEPYLDLRDETKLKSKSSRSG